MGVSIADNLVKITEALKKSARRAGRDPSEITLVAATKGVEVKRIKEAVKAGLRVFGESYVQEAREKIAKVKDTKKKWHLIGHLQKNKVKFAVELFDCIHTVDSLPLAREINRKTAKPMDVLIQVNLSGEKSKYGVKPMEVVELARAIARLDNLRLRGLMAIPPAFDDPEMVRPFFSTLRRLAERLNRERIPGVFMHDLSMGMSADFNIAIEEGATMVRIGTAIFGPREKPEAEKAVKAVKAKRPAAKKAVTKKAVTKKKSPAAKKPGVAKKTVTKAKKTAKKPQKKTKPAKAKVTRAATAKKAVTKKKSSKAGTKGTPKKRAVKAVKKGGAVKKAAAGKKRRGS